MMMMMMIMVVMMVVMMMRMIMMMMVAMMIMHVFRLGEVSFKRDCVFRIWKGWGVVGYYYYS